MKSRSRIMTALVRALDINSDERSWRVGSQGEESIGSRLDKLTDHGWHVLHAGPHRQTRAPTSTICSSVPAGCGR